MLLQRFWNDERGAVGAAEVILIMTILTIGVLVGLTSLRDATIAEFADYAAALASLNQSYSLSALSVSWGGTTLTTAPSVYTDAVDFCDSAGVMGSYGCINILSATPEQ